MQNSQESTCARVHLFIKVQAEVCNFIKKEAFAHEFSCEFCESFRNNFFIKPLCWLFLQPNYLHSIANQLTGLIFYDRDRKFNSLLPHLDHTLQKKLSFLLRTSSVTVTFTEEMLNGKLHFLCSDNKQIWS